MKTKIPIDIEVTHQDGELMLAAVLDVTSFLRRVVDKVERNGTSVESIDVELMLVTGKSITIPFAVSSISNSVLGVKDDKMVVSVSSKLDRSVSTVNLPEGKVNRDIDNTVCKNVIGNKAKDKNEKIGEKDEPVSFSPKAPDDPTKWTASHFQLYISYLFRKQYGVQSAEVSAAAPKAMVWTRIKQNLLVPFREAGFTNEHVKEYITWVFTDISGTLDFPVSLGFLFSRAVITRWIVHKHGKQPAKQGKDRWSKLAQNARNTK